MLLFLFGSSMYDACQKNYKCTMENVYLHLYNSLGNKNANTSPANVNIMSWIHMILHLTMVSLCRYNILSQLASMMYYYVQYRQCTYCTCVTWSTRDGKMVAVFHWTLAAVIWLLNGNLLCKKMTCLHKLVHWKKNGIQELHMLLFLSQYS